MTYAVAPVRFGIVGTGWRTDFFLRIARDLPDRFEVTGLVSRDAGRAAAVEAEWGIRGFTSVDDMIAASSPAFVVLSVPRAVAPGLMVHLAERGMPVLTETPPAGDLAGLVRLWEELPAGAVVQVAEQYHLSPLLSAQLRIAASGRLGAISAVTVAQCHDYHGVSVMRRALGIGFEDAAITAASFDSPLVTGPDRTGDPVEETIVTAHQVTARFDFGDRLGVYDFAAQQYFSWIRANRLLIRGDRGEIADREVRYLHDFRTPALTEIRRMDTGEGGNLEGKFLRGLVAGDEWVFENPFMPARLNDDEIAIAIAIARCLQAMADQVAGGEGFYGLAEASQDTYLALLMHEAALTGRAVRTERQVWTRQGSARGGSAGY